jgi:phage portal protein BeeE
MGTLTDRVRLSMARRLMPKTQDGIPADAAGGLLQGVSSGGQGPSPHSTTQAFLRAYSEQPWLRAVAWRIATSVAAVPWQVYGVTSEPNGSRFIRDTKAQTWGPKYRRRRLAELKAADQLVEIEDHPLLTLLKDPNAFHVGTSVRRLFQLYLDLVGESFGVIERNEFGVPASVWPVPPHWISATPIASAPFFEIEVGTFRAQVPVSEMIWMAEANPENPYERGRGTAQSLGDELDVSEYIVKFQKSFFWNQARPDLLVYSDEMTPEQTRSLENYWDARTRSFWRAFRPLFLNFKPEILEIKKSFSEMQMTDLSSEKRDTIVQVFGIPPEIIGIIESSNRATIQAADDLYARYVLEPRLEFWREYMQERLAPEYDERIIVDYVSPVEEDKTHALEVAKAAPWSITVDEWREMQGRAALEAEAGEVYAIPLNLQFVESHTGAALPGGSLGETDTDASEGEEGERSAGFVQRAVDRWIAKQEDDPFFVLVHRVADRLEPEVRRIFVDAIRQARESMDEAALAALANALRGGNVSEAIRRVPIPAIRIALEEIATPIARAGTEVARAASAEMESLFGISLDLEAVNVRAVEWAREHAVKLAVDLTDEMEAAIREKVVSSVAGEIDVHRLAREIRDLDLGLTRQQSRYVANFQKKLIEQGLPEAEIERRVKRYAEAWLRRRSVTIARTETINASNQGQQLTWEEAARQGLLDQRRTRKVWITTPDDRLDRKVCEPMPFLPANAAVPINGLFTTGDGRQIARPTAHPRCRCAMALQISPTPLRSALDENALFAYRVAAAIVALAERAPEQTEHVRAWPEDVEIHCDKLWPRPESLVLPPPSPIGNGKHAHRLADVLAEDVSWL